MSDTISFIHFTKEKSIGNDEGKNSTVFIAKDEQLGDKLVIKQMDKAKFKPDEYFSESKILYNSKHPNIAEIQYASQDDKSIYLAMPYYPNGSLYSIGEKRYFTVREIIKYSLDLLSAVNYIHSKQLLHLDIKPTNILLDNSGKAILTDFGLSRYMNEFGIANQPYNYRLHFDPECFIHSGRTVQSDIYQVGLTIYRLCNGVNILRQQSQDMKINDNKILKEYIEKGKFPDRKYFLPHIPKSLRKIVLKALQIDKSKRYANTIEIMNDLSDIDTNLDWVYKGKLNERYTKIDDSYKYVISVNSNNIDCYRINLKTDRKSNITKFCFKGLKQDDIDQHIYDTIGGLN